MENSIDGYELEFASFKEEFPLSQVGTGSSGKSMNVQWERLDVENVRRFRGVQSLDLSNDFTLLYAPNGVGKSTITECLELLKNGNVSRAALSAVSREFNLEKDLPSHGVDVTEVSITLVSDSGNCDANARFEFSTGVETIPTLPVTVVSRNTIRNAVTARDKDRFTRFLAIAQVPGLVEHYENLGAKYDSVKRLFRFWGA